MLFSSLFITATIASVVNGTPLGVQRHPTGKPDLVARSACVAADVALFKSVVTHPKYFCDFWLAQ